MQRSLVAVLHILYWLLFLFLLTTLYGFMSMNPAFKDFTLRKVDGFWFWIRLMIGFAIIPAIISFYASYTWLAPVLLSRRRFLLFVLTSLGISMLAAMAGALVESLPFVFGEGFLFNDGLRSALSILSIMTLGAWIHAVIGAVISGFVRWFDEQKTKESLEKKQLETELELLRARLHPHFLFNTLNNIDVMLEKDAAKASHYLHMLSDLLRYTLYESGEAEAPAEREIEQVEKYMHLQRLRSPFPERIQFSVSGSSTGLLLPPMLFTPYIENAFKHAIDHHPGPIIDIRFAFRGPSVYFCCVNQADTNTARQADGGMGLDLARKRLAMTYPERHTLSIEETNHQFTVEIRIDDDTALHHRGG